MPQSVVSSRQIDLHRMLKTEFPFYIHLRKAINEKTQNYLNYLQIQIKFKRKKFPVLIEIQLQFASLINVF
jgi:hypothetical protein